MEEFDLDDVLHLEDTFYKDGFKEGREKSTRDQYIEGKEYGYQTGYQRFLIVGYMKGLVQVWRSQIDQYPGLVPAMLDQLERLLDVPITNGDKEVAVYEQNLTKARNKLRVIAAVIKEQDKINDLDAKVKRIVGNLQVQEDMNEMW